MTTFKPAQSLDSQPIALWLSILQEQAKLLHSIQKNLPVRTAQAIKHCVISDRQLIIFVESASWASQLRFLHDKIMAGLIESGVTQVKGLQIKLLTNRQNTSKRRPPNLPSEAALRDLKTAYAGGEAKDALGQALSNLTLTLEKRLSAKS